MTGTRGAFQTDRASLTCGFMVLISLFFVIDKFAQTTHNCLFYVSLGAILIIAFVRTYKSLGFQTHAVITKNTPHLSLAAFL